MCSRDGSRRLRRHDALGRVFQRISLAGTRLTDLAEQAQVTEHAAGALVDELERVGYVTRRPDPTEPA
jgi:DNA-binding MarR family transcriptional regulator